MKLDKRALRRLIKEEMTRAVEAAQQDETIEEVGGSPAASGTRNRQMADQRYEDALEYLQQLMGQGREAIVNAADALRGGGNPGDTWHGGMNQGSPDAHMGEEEEAMTEGPGRGDVQEIAADVVGVIERHTGIIVDLDVVRSMLLNDQTVGELIGGRFLTAGEEAEERMHSEGEETVDEEEEVDEGEEAMDEEEEAMSESTSNEGGEVHREGEELSLTNEMQGHIDNADDEAGIQHVQESFNSRRLGRLAGLLED